jgi:DNA-binding winged helix-turn-helix (wHTH) protein
LRQRTLLSISESVSPRYALCCSKHRRGMHLRRCFRFGVKSHSASMGVRWLPSPLEWSKRSGSAKATSLTCVPPRLRRGTHVLKLERIPFEILLLLLEHRDEIVPRDQIVSRVWGQGVFLDTDNSIRGAIRKLRQVLKDDAEAPRFIQTVTGQGYRFIASVIAPKEASTASEPDASVVPTSDRDFVSELDGWLETRRLHLAEQDRTAEKVMHPGTAHGQGNRKAYRWPFVGAMALLSVACLLSFLAVWSWRRAASLPTRSHGKIVLAVLPFENLSRDPDQEFFSVTANHSVGTLEAVSPDEKGGLNAHAD